MQCPTAQNYNLKNWKKAILTFASSTNLIQMLLYRIIESPRNSWTQKWQTNSNKSKLAIMCPPHDFIRRTLMTRAQLKRALQRANYTKINYIALHSSIEQEWTLLKREQRHPAIADYLSDWLYHLICRYLSIVHISKSNSRICPIYH